MTWRFLALGALLSLPACGGESNQLPDGSGADAARVDGNPDGGSPPAGDGGGQATDWVDRTGISCNGGAQPSATEAPDLAVDLINGGSSYDSTTGDIKVNFSYLNAGLVAAGPYKVGIFLYPDVSDRCEAYYLSQFSKGGLEPSNSHSGTATTHLKDLPQAVPHGDYEVGFVLDVENAVVESRENNNVKILGIVRL